jgi:hypothetical protein
LQRELFSTRLCCRPDGRATSASRSPTAPPSPSRKDAPRAGLITSPASPFRPAQPAQPRLSSAAWLGLAERRGPTADSFWTWREVMYHFLQRLSPETSRRSPPLPIMEMLEAGFTTVGEFHYLHHDVDGRPYANLGEMAERIAAASAQNPYRLTLLPSFYAYGGFGGARRSPGSAASSTIRIASSIWFSAPRATRGNAARKGGVGNRAALPARGDPGDAKGDLPGDARRADPYPRRRAAAGGGGMRRRPRPSPGGMAARECRARFPLVRDPTRPTRHRGEIVALAASRAVVGLCPLTEASLGDGLFDGAAYLAAGGRFGIGTDSNIQIDAAAELRQLEYGQRRRGAPATS